MSTQFKYVVVKMEGLETNSKLNFLSISFDNCPCSSV